MIKNEYPFNIDDSHTLSFEKKSVSELPELSGVYMFLNETYQVIYVGKARNLKARVSSYFSTSLLLPKTRMLVEEARYIRFKLTLSEVEALILESALIKLFKPKYNVQLKDDKSYPWLYILRQDIKPKNADNPLWYPVVRIKRNVSFEKDFIQIVQASELDLFQDDITQRSAIDNVKSGQKDKKFGDRVLARIGPFVNAGELKKALRALRQIFPYPTCSKQKFLQHRQRGRACLYGQMGLCPAPCVNQEGVKRAKHNVRELIKFLKEGHSKYIEKLHKQMYRYAAKLEYEKARHIRDILQKINALANIKLTSSSEVIPNSPDDIRLKRAEEISKLFGVAWQNTAESRKIAALRVEAYDNSSLQGQHTTSSMVVSIGGELRPQEYKRFKVNALFESGFVDVIAMFEVIERRFRHTDWGIPQLLLIDGSKPQLVAVYVALIVHMLESIYKIAPQVENFPTKLQELLLYCVHYFEEEKSGVQDRLRCFQKIKKKLKTYINSIFQLLINEKIFSENAALKAHIDHLKKLLIWGIYKPYDYFITYIPHLKVVLGSEYDTYKEFLQNLPGFQTIISGDWLRLLPRSRNMGVEHLRLLRDEAHRFSKKYHSNLRDSIK